MSEVFIEPWLPFCNGDTRPDHKPYQVISVSVPGIAGAKGNPGESLKLLDSYNTYAAFISAHPTGNAGDLYCAGANLYTWSTTTNMWVSKGSLTGGLNALMNPDPRTYFLAVLNEEALPDSPNIPGQDIEDAVQPVLGVGRLDYMILA